VSSARVQPKLAPLDGTSIRGVTEVRLYTNEAMTENLSFYPRHGYRETGRAVQDGFRRVYFSKTVRQDDVGDPRDGERRDQLQGGGLPQ
jgi:hypothetical protein